jgi:hypothetical protein
MSAPFARPTSIMIAVALLVCVEPACAAARIVSLVALAAAEDAAFVVWVQGSSPSRVPGASYRALLRSQDQLVADEQVSPSDGVLLMDGLAAGWYELRLEAPGLRATSVTFRLGDESLLDLGELQAEPAPAPR